MYIDHDLEIVHPWHYSTYLLEDDIRVSFTPAKKSAMFRIDFPAGTEKHILIQGSDDFKGNSEHRKGCSGLVDKIRYKTRGLNSVDPGNAGLCVCQTDRFRGKGCQGSQDGLEQGSVFSATSSKKRPLPFLSNMRFPTSAMSRQNTTSKKSWLAIPLNRRSRQERRHGKKA